MLDGADDVVRAPLMNQEDAAESCRPQAEDLMNGSHHAEKTNKESSKENHATREAERIAQSSGEDYGDQKYEEETVLRLSPTRLYELTSSPQWLPVRRSMETLNAGNVTPEVGNWAVPEITEIPDLKLPDGERAKGRSQPTSIAPNSISVVEGQQFAPAVSWTTGLNHTGRPQPIPRTPTFPLLRRRMSSSKGTGSSKALHASSVRQSKATPLPLLFDEGRVLDAAATIENPEPSPMPQSIPLPPRSLPTHLQLELSSQRPSPLYIHRSATSDYPYESSRMKTDRLMNFLVLPPQLEQILWFGTLACLDAWLYSFTILPLRFLKALSILIGFWGRCIIHEVRFLTVFLYTGLGRIWHRIRHSERGNNLTKAAIYHYGMRSKAEESDNDGASQQELNQRFRRSSTPRYRRTKSASLALSTDQKADILKGLLIATSCVILMYFDASRMYHGIRGQAAIKLYVIYNVLEVCDRLFSALGQDILECLFSKETLECDADSRSKIWRPFWLFLLALAYNLVHSTALFYQVITLNVAVNSYSNALLTLLMSNQFVEIKSTVFKRIEKENLFQLTCADVVERFQLWLMMMIIASRNFIETGGLNLDASASSVSGGSSILPKSLAIFPDWTGEVMGPFFLVLGSEMLVDWIKHAYITKFNNTKPAIYGRFLDVLAKDYYSNAFADQNLTRRLGLPIIPLACLFIRASVQTYHMFLATHMLPPLPSTATAISLESATASPATTAALRHLDQIFWRALGRSTFGAGDSTIAPTNTGFWTLDDIIAFTTMAVFFLILFLVLVVLKLVLGMALLSFARGRYKGMKARENNSVHAEGKRVGSWGVVEVDEDKRRWIYQDDSAGARKLREREREVREKEKRVEKEGGQSFDKVTRYSMVAKRIW